MKISIAFELLNHSIISKRNQMRSSPLTTISPAACSSIQKTCLSESKVEFLAPWWHTYFKSSQHCMELRCAHENYRRVPAQFVLLRNTPLRRQLNYWPVTCFWLPLAGLLFCWVLHAFSLLCGSLWLGCETRSRPEIPQAASKKDSVNGLFWDHSHKNNKE